LDNVTVKNMDSASEKGIRNSQATIAAHSQHESKTPKDAKDMKSTDSLRLAPADATNRTGISESSTSDFHDAIEAPVARMATATDGQPKDLAPEETRSKGRTALIMTALCVCLHKNKLLTDTDTNTFC
jgi:hypothetical protein